MPKRPTREEAEAILKGEDRRQQYALLKQLPPDVDPRLAAKAVLSYLGPNNWSFARNCRRVPAAVVEAMLGQLPEHHTPMATFLSAYLPGQSDPSAAWERALNAMLDLDLTYAWGSKQRRAKFAALAKDPQLVAALQATAVGWEDVKPDILAVLTVDASDASLDALMPHFERAAKSLDRGLDTLERLKTHATLTPQMKAMFARVDAMLEGRNASSPALELARNIGFGALPVFWFRASFYSDDAQPHSSGSVHASISVDSRSPNWLSASISRWSNQQRHSTTLSVRGLVNDDLGLGGAPAEQLPRWLADAAVRLKIPWSFESGYLSTSLRGARRDRLQAWIAARPAERWG